MSSLDATTHEYVQQEALSQTDLGYREILMLAPTGLCVSRGRVIRFANAALERMFGVRPGVLENTSFANLYPSLAEYQHTGARLANALADCDSYTDERVMRRSGGELFWCQVAGHSLREAGLFIWKFEDLSNQRPFKADLSLRDREVAARVVEGRTSKEIARELGLSHRTIEKYRARLMHKFGAATSSALVQKIISTRA